MGLGTVFLEFIPDDTTMVCLWSPWVTLRYSTAECSATRTCKVSDGWQGQMAIDSVKFRRKVGPGDTLRMHVETLRGGGKVWKFKGRATVDGEVACECEFTAMMDLPK